jgi:lysyl-tRNA synthetase class II
MEQTESELLALRREKLAALEKLGVAPFGAAFQTSGDIAEVREKFSEGANFRIAGPISSTARWEKADVNSVVRLNFG